MISGKLPLLSMVALFCMVFIGLTQTAPLNKRHDGGSVAYADFETEQGHRRGRYTWA
jgi:hypothetical protein